MSTDGMSFEEIKNKIANLDIHDQRRLIREMIPKVWEKACADPSCFLKLKELVDSTAWRPYDEMHMGGI